MSRYTLFLRGINVGGNATVNMALLKESLIGEGFTHVSTYLNSGNVILETEKDKAATEGSVQQLIAQRFGISIAVFVLTKEDLQEIVENNPFDAATESENSKRMVVLFREFIAPGEDTLTIKDEKEDADYYLRRNMAYIYYKVGAGQAKITHPTIKQLFKQVSTSRNWNTITKMLEKM